MTSKEFADLKIGDSVYWDVVKPATEEIVISTNESCIKTIDHRGGITEIDSESELWYEYSAVASDPIRIDRTNIMHILREKIEDLEDIYNILRKLQ